MNCLVIHAIGDKIREENIKKQFESQSIKLDYQIVPAIMNPYQPAVGIMRSFKKCISVAIENDWEEVCIFEDDFKCLGTKSIEIFFELFKSEIKNKISGLFLAGIYEGEIAQPFWSVSKVFGKMSGLHAIIIPKEYYEDILNAEEPYNLDHWISQIANLECYVAYPLLIVQNDGYSYNKGEKTFYTENLHHRYRFYSDEV